MLKYWSNLEEVPYSFSRSSIKFQGHTGQEIVDFDPNWVFEFTDGNEMMHKAWCNIEELLYYFSRSSIKFPGHTGWKINDLNPICVRLLGRSTEQRTRSVSSGLSKQLGHMPRIRSKQSIHQMGRFAHLSVTLLTQYFSLPRSPVRSDPSKEAVTNDQSWKGNLFDFFACRRS